MTTDETISYYENYCGECFENDALETTKNLACVKFKPNSYDPEYAIYAKYATKSIFDLLNDTPESMLNTRDGRALYFDLYKNSVMLKICDGDCIWVPAKRFISIFR